MASAGRDSCINHLPDGRRLELCSQEGADAFITYNPSQPFEFFTLNLGDCIKIRSQSRRLNAGEKDRLLMIGFTIDSISKYATKEVFAKYIPDKELIFWLDYVMEELKKLASNERWQRTGLLDKHDAFTINPCVSMFQHEAPAKLALER